QIHFNETLRKVSPWFTDDLYKEIDEIYIQTTRYLNGIFETKITFNGLDIGLELMRIRGGAFINELASRLKFKFDCYNKDTAECRWIKGLKYYAYSVHDSTIFQFFAIMGIDRKVIKPGVYPAYAAASFVELWRNETDKQPYFRLLYRANDTSPIYPITMEIDKCQGKEFCDLQVFRDFAEKVKLYKPVPELCEVNPEEEGKETTEAKQPRTPPSVPEEKEDGGACLHMFTSALTMLLCICSKI
ncbi:unnamed protein product, partial [Strongylus vulgaris]